MRFFNSAGPGSEAKRSGFAFWLSEWFCLFSGEEGKRLLKGEHVSLKNMWKIPTFLDTKLLKHAGTKKNDPILFEYMFA